MTDQLPAAGTDDLPGDVLDDVEEVAVGDSVSAELEVDRGDGDELVSGTLTVQDAIVTREGLIMVSSSFTPDDAGGST